MEFHEILDKKYICPTRPYSDKELGEKRKDICIKHYLSDKWTCHKKCGHIYKVKKDGKKYKYMIENNTEDSQNCSVCWKLRQTPKSHKQKAYEMLEIFLETFYDYPETCTYDSLYVEEIFYMWLYK